jgi:endo-1,4-beta-mannosidase
MGGYIHDLDPSHLVSIGLDQETADTSWRDVCSVPTVGVCSFHLYLGRPGDPAYANEQAAVDALRRHAQDARSLGKIVTLDEVGVSKTTRPFGLAPRDALATLVRNATATGYQEVLIWNWSLRPDETFGFSPEGTKGVYNATDLASILRTAS